MVTPEQSHRLGLGLSGGGFRASFYHIGVLAQMAEQGLLRHLEVISTVSGGSIIGALYYLHVKKLLESKADAAITDQDYVDIVKTIETDFLKATEHNIRTATYANLVANTRMVLANYSRSDRIAELYERWIYQGVLTNVDAPLQMRHLKIQPLEGPADFRPKTHNVDRTAKVPILVLNATTLNTGRGWEFTAVSMGEPPPLNFTATIDKKPIRLVWADSYAVMAPIQQDFPLAHAVAASACVPALFDPMAVSGLYHDGQQGESIRVQLVDGGVYDNQGIEGLLSNGCTCVIISDASGQMGTENEPSTSMPLVLARADSILQDRNRTKGLLALFNQIGEDNVVFVNLRQGLGVREIAWIDQNDHQAPDHSTPTNTCDFGFDPRVQDRLSRIRTDLDAFTEVEAYSLMLNGYRMIEGRLKSFRERVLCPEMRDAGPTVRSGHWKFLGIAPWAKEPSEDYLKQLTVAEATFGKSLMLVPWLWGPLMAAMVLLLWLLWPQVVALYHSAIPVSLILIGLVLWLINSLAPKLLKLLPFLNGVRPQAVMARAAVRMAYLSTGSALLWFYIKAINPLFLRRGRIANLK